MATYTVKQEQQEDGSISTRIFLPYVLPGKSGKTIQADVTEDFTLTCEDCNRDTVVIRTKPIVCDHCGCRVLHQKRCPQHVTQYLAR